MRFLNRLSPRYTPPAIATRGELAILRDSILQSMLLLFSFLGLIVVALAAVHLSLPADMPLLAAYVLLYGLATITALARGLPYRLRGHFVLFLVYLLAVSELFESGQLGEVRMMLIVFVTITAVLFGYRGSIIAILLSTATIVAAGVLGSRPEVLAWFPAFENIHRGTDWITSAFTLLMFSTVVSGAIVMIINGLEMNLRRQEALTQALESERVSLENRIEERTADLSRRLAQLRTASSLTRSMTSLADPDEMLRQTVELIRESFDLYYVGVFLLDEAGQNAVLHAGTGEAGRQMLADGHRLAVGGSSMIGWCIANRKARVALDVGAEAVRFSNPNLPLTRSELALPILAGDKVLGAMTVQSSKPNAFDEDDITVLQGIADGLGVALENDRLYNETRQSLEEIRAFNREYLQRSWAETIESYGELSYQYDNAALADPTGPTEVLEIPVLLRNEEIGQIILETDRAQLSKDETNLIENIINQTAIALENARLLRETEQRAIQEQKLNELTAHFSSALSIDEILRAAAQDLGQLPSVAGVAVRLSPAGAPTRLTGGNGKEPTA